MTSPTMPSAIEVRKVPIHSVADASELAKLIDDGVMAADRVDRDHRQDRGQRRGQRLHPDHLRPGVPRGARREGRARPSRSSQIPIVWSGGTDGVISPHATIFATSTDAEPTDEPRLTVGFAMSEQLLPEDIGRVAMVTKVADAVKVAMERAGITDVADVHYVQTKTPLLTVHTIRDAKSPRQDRVDRAHPRVDGPLQRHHRAGHRRRARRDRDADRRRRDARPRRCSPRSPPAPRASSSTRRRWSWSATRPASAGATGSATR